MKIEIADCSGFCFGVKRAIKMAQEALEKNKTKEVYSLGHIIHNSQVVEELSQKGLKPIKELTGVEEGVVVISSHGAGPKIFKQIETKGIGLVNATCPYVMSAQKIVKSLSDEGYSVLILGDRHHPEVEALVGLAGKGAVVIKDEEELEGQKLPSSRIGVVSQTTQTSKRYFRIISKILSRGFSEVRIFNTICSDTQKRQESAARLAKDADLMIIAGGRMSANTKRLFEICSGICKNTYHIETAQELKGKWFEGKSKIGIASGASTPDWIIKSIKKEILLRRGIYAR